MKKDAVKILEQMRHFKRWVQSLGLKEDHPDEVSFAAGLFRAHTQTIGIISESFALPKFSSLAHMPGYSTMGFVSFCYAILAVLYFGMRRADPEAVKM